MKEWKKDFGTVVAVPMVTKDGGYFSEWWEVEYRNENGEVIGYWAYGRWDPSLPYRDE